MDVYVSPVWAGDDDRAVLLRRLRWQARRGILELDLILDAFLQKYGATFSIEEARAFSSFLADQDQTLFDVLMRGQAYQAEDPFSFVPRLRAVSAVPVYAPTTWEKKEQ